ncbi:hypothetical protein [Domibacillus indicus]|uniref:hypothetical protein n=1 Tax=Domibacillus indicus TaxID=1437523 RepID=UPI0018CD0940|nr:hypothetical protein [Domibacillus indicus]
MVIKDFLLIRMYLFTWLAVLIVLYTAGASFAAYQKQFYLVFPFLLVLYVGHTLVLPVTAGILLKAEEKGQYWLHGTADGKRLLSSKLIVSTIVLLASLLLTNVLMAFSLMAANGESQLAFLEGQFPWVEGVLFNGGIIFSAFYLTTWGLFLWSLFHSMAQSPALRKIRWILIIAVYFITQTVIVRVTEWSAVKAFLQSWSIQIESPLSSTGGMNEISFTMDSNGLLVWPLLLSCAGFCLLFFAAAWLLDRKVEV